jgi:hypothetical protein
MLNIYSKFQVDISSNFEDKDQVWWSWTYDWSSVGYLLNVNIIFAGRRLK